MLEKFVRSLLVAALLCASVAKAQTDPLHQTTAGDMRLHCMATLELMNRVAEGHDPSMFSDAELGMSLSCSNLWRGIATVLAFNCWSRSQGYSPMLAAESPESALVGISMFVLWVDTNPDSAGESAIEVMIASLISDFPCAQ